MSLVFFDLEGTLTDRLRQLPSSAEQAIRLLKRNGHKAFLCTGCSMAEIPYNVRHIAFDGIIAAGGASIHVKDQVVLETIIPPDWLDALLPRLERAPIDVWLEGPEHLYVSSLSETPFFKRLISYMGLEKSVFRDWHLPMVKANKFTYWVRDLVGFGPTRDLLTQHFDLIERDSSIGEALPKGINKGSGIVQLIHHYGWESDDTYAFGDSENDLSMCRQVNHPIAMASGSPALIQVCDYVAPPPEEDGIYLALSHYHLI